MVSTLWPIHCNKTNTSPSKTLPLPSSDPQAKTSQTSKHPVRPDEETSECGRMTTSMDCCEPGGEVGESRKMDRKLSPRPRRKVQRHSRVKREVRMRRKVELRLVKMSRCPDRLWIGRKVESRCDESNASRGRSYDDGELCISRSDVHVGYNTKPSSCFFFFPFGTDGHASSHCCRALVKSGSKQHLVSRSPWVLARPKTVNPLPFPPLPHS